MIRMEFLSDVSGERLDVFLARQIENLSRSHVQRLLAKGQIAVDGRVCKANYKLRPGERIICMLPPAGEALVLPEDLPLDVLYEDADIIVVNKARGMVVHPAAGVDTGTLVNALLFHCQDLSGINGVLRPGIVHRLDKDTSGVMVAAKNDQAHCALAQQIGEKRAHREYRAIVHGNIKERRGTIMGDIGRHPTDRKKMAIVRENGKPATTHQIRVHMASIGHPLVGDTKYTALKNPFSIVGQALHSFKLTLLHPRSGREMVFTAALPRDMEEILCTLRSGR